MKRISIIVIVIVILVAGCSLNESKTNIIRNDYSFENPDIIAYINGEPVSEIAMKNYIIMKKAYMEALAKFIGGYSDIDELFFSERIFIRWDLERIKEIKSYSENDWMKDYYKSIFLCKKFNEEFKNADEQLKIDVEAEVEYVLDRAKNEKGYSIVKIDDGTLVKDPGITVEIVDGTLDVVPVIQSVANDLGISFEECVNNVFRPFWITEYIYKFLLNIRYDKLNYGEIVEYNGSNELDYIDYVLKVFEINKNYLDSLLDKVEIVER